MKQNKYLSCGTGHGPLFRALTAVCKTTETASKQEIWKQKHPTFMMAGKVSAHSVLLEPEIIVLTYLSLV